MNNSKVTTVAGFALVIAALVCNSQPTKMPPADPSQFNLHLELPPTVRLGSQCDMKITVTNIGESNARLVLPGDGSESHWRTPIVGWSILPSDSELEHPVAPPLPQGLSRCGNINALNRNEIFTLKPGEKRDLSEWVWFPHDLPIGSYRVVFYYSNSPALKWSGLPLGTHDRVAMAEVQSSTRVALVSNEVNLIVTK